MYTWLKRKRGRPEAMKLLARVCSGNDREQQETEANSWEWKVETDPRR